jgi:hypothetical protein
MLKRLFCLSFIAWIGGCAYSVHQVHVSDFDAPYRSVKSGKLVRASAEQFVILGFTDNTDYVDQAFKVLQKRCPKGRISGITTQYSTALGFFSWTNKILMQGLCFKA